MNDSSSDITRIELSEYVKSLDHEDAALYVEKLTEDGAILPDPCAVTKSAWVNNAKGWPDIGYPDIYEYFVETSSLYSRAQVKHVKSLDGYQYFVCGHVQQILLHDPNVKDHVFLKADVLPSQRQSNKKDMYKAYIIAHKNGEILTVHCTCMAGSGKACSHAAAIAYKVEAMRRLSCSEVASTSELCSWNDMSKKKATQAMLMDIDFQRPRYGQTQRVPPILTLSRKRDNN